MAKRPTHSAAELIPDRPTIDKVRAAARDCQACDLWRLGTQTVFGDGAKKAQLMFVGEQPGNDEDLRGHPFVGPAGQLRPSSILRAPDDDARRREMKRFTDDLRAVARALSSQS